MFLERECKAAIIGKERVEKGGEQTFGNRENYRKTL